MYIRIRSDHAYMQRSTPFLEAHVVTASQDLSILGYQACTNRNAAFSLSLTGLLDGSNESGVSFHCSIYSYGGG
jgi:hypothetical protein